LSQGIALTTCIEQDFERTVENEVVGVRGNKALLDEMIMVIKCALKNTTDIIESKNEIFEREEIVGLFCLYSLHRRLQPRNVIPEEKILSLLWKFQKKIPCIVTCQNISWDLGTEYLGIHIVLYCIVLRRKVGEGREISRRGEPVELSGIEYNGVQCDEILSNPML
jgi:WASH complex subunit 7, N-terminal